MYNNNNIVIIDGVVLNNGMRQRFSTLSTRVVIINISVVLIYCLRWCTLPYPITTSQSYVILNL